MPLSVTYPTQIYSVHVLSAIIGLVTFTVNPEKCGGWRLATRLDYHRMFEVNSLEYDNVYRIFTGEFGDIRNRHWLTNSKYAES